ncbi:hypothetical protein OH77DRAFT_84930 [Trametes cingulata]|nr:hypothetical protein OH77DRAFT_84930 [Trametes cingulata]
MDALPHSRCTVLVKWNAPHTPAAIMPHPVVCTVDGFCSRCARKARGGQSVASPCMVRRGASRCPSTARTCSLIPAAHYPLGEISCEIHNQLEELYTLSTNTSPTLTQIPPLSPAMSDPSHQPFNLDFSGVAGFFGGDVSVTAMATVHIYEGRKWLGWYNQPGSYEIAKRYGQLSRSRFWDALYPGVNVEPSVLFEYDGTEGPKFTATQSGTSLAKTGHVARLFAEECKDTALAPGPYPPMRRTTPGFVTIATLTHVPEPLEIPRQERDATSILASIPIAASLAACAACAVIHDWYCFAVILLGIISSGLSCYVIGTGVLKFSHPKPADGAPVGDGVLHDGSSELVVLRGPEGAVNSITRGRFALEYASKPAYHNIGVCSVLLTLHFIAQLLLIPQGTIHGQLLFLGSLCVSWMYNSYLASLDREGIQRSILREQVLRTEPGQLQKYQLGTRTSMVVFTLLALAPAKTATLRKVLDDLLPNDTDTWSKWKEEVLAGIEGGFRDGDGSGFTFNFDPAEGPGKDKLLAILYDDAQAAATMYRIYRQRARPVYADRQSSTLSFAKDESVQPLSSGSGSCGYTRVSGVAHSPVLLTSNHRRAGVR